jgi:hypothetical protein
VRFDYDRRAADRLLRSDTSWLRAVGNAVRDEARRNVDPSLEGKRAPDAANAIVAIPGEDGTSPYVDVGYDKHHPGFYLWWHEVGTEDNAPRPHLRPAVRPGLID